jgi:hypothetical protein
MNDPFVRLINFDLYKFTFSLTKFTTGKRAFFITVGYFPHYLSLAVDTKWIPYKDWYFERHRGGFSSQISQFYFGYGHFRKLFPGLESKYDIQNQS